MNSRAQIIVTLGPASEREDIFSAMLAAGADVARFNFAWQTVENRGLHVALVRAAAAASGRRVPIIADLPGPRVQQAEGHGYDARLPSLTQKDEEALAFCVEQKIEYVALSFVGSARDIKHCREALMKLGGRQKIIAKIERKAAVENIDAIIAAADAVMVARGDLGSEVPLEQIPFIQKTIVGKAKTAGKPVIVATQMMLSMAERREPTRAEVADIEEAIGEGADAVMLSEETASGKYPAEAVSMMEKAVTEAEKHLLRNATINAL